MVSGCGSVDCLFEDSDFGFGVDVSIGSSLVGLE